MRYAGRYDTESNQNERKAVTGNMTAAPTTATPEYGAW